jgi:hypothetical protein
MRGHLEPFIPVRGLLEAVSVVAVGVQRRILGECSHPILVIIRHRSQLGRKLLVRLVAVGDYVALAPNCALNCSLSVNDSKCHSLPVCPRLMTNDCKKSTICSVASFVSPFALNKATQAITLICA